MYPLNTPCNILSDSPSTLFQNPFQYPFSTSPPNTPSHLTLSTLSPNTPLPLHSSALPGFDSLTHLRGGLWLGSASTGEFGMIGDRAVFGMVSEGGVDVSEGGVDVMSEGGGGIGSSGSTGSTGTNRLVT